MRGLSLCPLNGVRFNTLALVESRSERGGHHLHPTRRGDEITGVYGRVVMVEVTDVSD